MFDRFDFATYRQMLRWMTRDRPCVGFSEALELGDDPYCIVRHDVDFSLSAALRMAAVEAELGIKATYFLLFSAVHYNLLAPGNICVPLALAELGHEVGLHYDSTAVAHMAPDDAVAVLRTEAGLLGALAGVPVNVVARHNPSLGGDDPLARNEDFVNAYAPCFTSEITYVSDSCGAWRPEALGVLNAEDPPRHVQLLVHPIFWDDEPLDRWTHLERLRRTHVAELDSQVAFARDVWKGHPAVAEHDRRVSAAGSSPDR